MLNKNERKDILEFTTEFNRYIRERDDQCITCHTKRHLTCSHLITAQKTVLRWDYNNCHCQCRGCNKAHEHYPEIYTMTFIQKFGLQLYETLVKMSFLAIPLPDEEMIKAMFITLNNKFDELKKQKECQTLSSAETLKK